MTEQEEHVNHFLTLFIEKEWVDNSLRYCSSNPNFFTPNDFACLRKWMEKNESELWERYLAYIRRCVLRSALLVCSSTILREWLNPSNLFEFLKDMREEWEWIFCFDGCMKCKNDTRCNHEGKLQHPAAKYLDSLEV